MHRRTTATILALVATLLTAACGAAGSAGAGQGSGQIPITPGQEPTQMAAIETPIMAVTVPPTEGIAPQPSATQTGDSEMSDPQQERAITAARRQLAQTVTNVDDAVIVSVTAQEWPDSALGCPQPGMMYQQVITPGYLVVLKTAGKLHHVHTDSSGRAVVCERAADLPRAAKPAPLLTVTRSGGLAGHTSTLVVRRDGSTELRDKGAGPRGTTPGKLLPTQLGQLKEALGSREWKTVSIKDEQSHADGYQYEIRGGGVEVTTHDGVENPQIVDVILMQISSHWSNSTRSR